MNDELAEYFRERDAVLLKCDPDALIAFMHKHDLPTPSSRKAAEIMLHKTITAATLLPLKFRISSKQWLTERGYHSLDDGELKELRQ